MVYADKLNQEEIKPGEIKSTFLRTFSKENCLPKWTKYDTYVYSSCVVDEKAEELGYSIISNSHTLSHRPTVYVIE